MTESFEVHSPEQLAELAAGLCQRMKIGQSWGFIGELGAGKTTLIRELVRALGSADQVTSPTYTLENVYTSSSLQLGQTIPIYHWDLYRLGRIDALPELEDRFNRLEGLLFIEWPERAGGVLGRVSYQLSLNFIEGRPESRRLSLDRVS